MNRTQHYSLLKAMEIDKNNLLKYQELYKYAYILSDGIFKIVFAEEKDHTLLISLVNAMLGLQGDDAIKDITLEMQEFPGVFNKKDCILDIIGPRGVLHLPRHREPGPYQRKVRTASYLFSRTP